MKTTLTKRITLEPGDLDFISLHEILEQSRGRDIQAEFESNGLKFIFDVRIYEDSIYSDKLFIWDDELEIDCEVIDNDGIFDQIIDELSNERKEQYENMQAIEETEDSLNSYLNSQGNYGGW